MQHSPRRLLLAAERVIAGAHAPFARSEADRLINQEKVDIILGIYSSAHAVPLAEKLDQQKKILWITTAVSSAVVKGKNRQYTFRTNVHSDQYGEASATFVSDNAKPKLGLDPKDVKVAIIHEDGAYGVDVSKGNEEGAKKAGFNIVLKEGYSATAPDLASLVTKLKRARPDVIFHTGYNPDISLFLRQARELRLLDSIDAELAALASFLDQRGYEDPRVRLLMTLPGVDVAVAQTLLAVLGDHARLKDGDHAASYLGLVPSTRQSADVCHHGPITKQGKGHARWILVQAAQHLGSHPGPLGVFFRRLMKRKNRNVAVVATARKLVVIAWLMLKNGEPYRYALPGATQRKLSRLRVAAGHRRPSGLPKGSPRPAAYGSGQGTRAVPALQDLYVAEGLPAIQPIASGEQTALRKAGVVRYVLGLGTSHRVPRKLPPMSPSPQTNGEST